MRHLEFPPQFNPVLPGGMGTLYVPAIDPNGSDYRPENAYGPRDPFRPQLRRLLATEFGSTQKVSLPKRLSINEFLNIERRPNAVVSSYTSLLQYRPLTLPTTEEAERSIGRN